MAYDFVQPPPRIIVEVGCGIAPFPGPTGMRKLRPDEIYYGVDFFGDRSDEEIAELQRQTQMFSEGQIHIQRGDGTCLPFENSSVGEVVYVNVFSYVPTRPHHEALIQEGARILHGLGQMTVVETISPTKMPLPRLRSLMERAGLVQSNVGLEYNQGEIAMYNLPSTLAQPQDYVAVFKH